MPFMKNRRTGEIIEVDASGRPVGAPQMPPADPTFPLQAPKMNADIYNTQTNARGNEIDNRIKEATAPYLIGEAAAKAAAAALTAREAQDKRDKLDASRARALGELQSGIGNIDRVAGHLRKTGGWWEVGKTGAPARWGGTDPGDTLYAGSDAADFDAMTAPIIANTAFDKIMQMRAESPTGAGLGGNTSDKDVELLKSATAELKPTQSADAYQRSLGTARSAYVRNLRNLDRGAGNRAAVNNPSMTGTDANYALAQGFQSLQQQMEGKTPEQRARMLEAFNADPNVQTLKSRSGFRDPGGRRSAPRKSAGGAKFLGFE